MSAKRRYSRGRNFEYVRRDAWKKLGATVVRSGGSRGPFDLVIIQPSIVTLLQCKRCQTEAQANLLLKKFEANPPLLPGNYHQTMECLVVETGEVRSTTI